MLNRYKNIRENLINFLPYFFAISKINNGTAHHRDNIQYPIRNWKSSGVILFTYEQVTEIINALSNTKESIQSLAKKYNVSDSAILGIKKWRILEKSIKRIKSRYA